MEYMLFVYVLGAAYTCGKIWQTDGGDEPTLSGMFRERGIPVLFGYAVAALFWPFVLGMSNA